MVIKLRKTEIDIYYAHNNLFRTQKEGLDPSTL